MTEIHQDAGDQESYRFPLRLYINHRDTGADAGGMFLQKVESAELEIRQPGQSPKPVTASQPFSSDDIPGAALVSSIDFSRLSAGPIELVWVLHMDNSDTIRIRSNLVITPVRTYQYDAGNADLSDSQALQALIDRLAEETGRKDTVNIELPPVTYEEPITLHSRAFNLTGTQSPVFWWKPQMKPTTGSAVSPALTSSAAAAGLPSLLPTGCGPRTVTFPTGKPPCWPMEMPGSIPWTVYLKTTKPDFTTMSPAASMMTTALREILSAATRPLLFWRMWLQTSGWILAAACLREIRRILTTAAISPSTFRKPSSSKGVLTV